jgi:CotH kinase protein/Lamin Tail Domain
MLLNMKSIIPLIAMLALCSPASALTNANFEATPFSAGWTSTGVPAGVAGIAPDSVRGVRFTAGGQALRQAVAWPADWYVECFFAIRSTTARAFSLIIEAGASNAVNFRYEAGAFAAFNGTGWSALGALGAVTPSIDANGDGDLADVGDTKNVYRLRITGRGWGAAGATYDVQVSEANSTAFARTASGLTFYQVAGAAGTARPTSIKSGSEFGSNPGWWLDDVSSHEEQPPADPPVIAWLVASPEQVAAGAPVTLTWSVSGADSLTLSPGGPALTVAGTSAVVNPAATTTYTLTAANSGGSVARTITVGVGGIALPLRLTEFMASNVSGLVDEDGDQSDWIELHNPNAWSVNLGGLALTDDVRVADKWIFPTRSIGPGGYLIVFASSKNRAPGGGQLHTNFSLSAAGEYLALVDREGAAIQAFAPVYDPQADDVSTDGTAFFGAPTPGTANVPGPYLSAPAFVRQPDNTWRITVQAVGAASVMLKHRTMYAAEQSVTMNAEPGSLWSAVLPAAAAAPGEMLRWYFSATDAASRTVRLPAFLSPDAPQYLGTVVANAAVISQLRIFEWFMDPAFNAAADTLTGARCSVYHLGQFYDNVLVTLRGATTALFSKKPHKFQFHDTQPFRFRADLPRVDEINVNAAFSDGSYLRDYLAYRDLLAAGIPTPSVEPLRVQRNGAFHSMGVMIENVDRRFLRRHNLDETGPLFKATGNGSWLTGTTGFETRNGAVLTDLAAFTAGLAPANANRQTYLFDNTNLPAVVSYLAANVLGSIYNPQKNYYVFRNTRKGEWQAIAWDRDFAYGDIFLGSSDTRHPPGGASPDLITNERIEHGASNEDLRGGNNRLFEAVIATPATRAMFYRRLRTLLDGHFATGHIESILDAWQPRLKPEADLDRAVWGFAPGPGGPYSFGADTFDTSLSQIRTQYLPARRTCLFSNNTTPTNGVPASATWMRGSLPAVQTASPVIVIESAETNPLSGNQDQEYIELRNPTAESSDLSGWTMSGGVEHTLQPGTVIPAGGSLFLTPDALAFRARTVSPRAGESRYVQGNYNGHLSNFSEVLTLADAGGAVIATFITPNTPSDLQRWLVVSEVMYHPAPPHPDAEFIEVHNTSPTLTLNLAGAAFTAGVEFTFPAGFTLAPGARAVVVLNAAAFAAAYPAFSGSIAGSFAAGRLANGGEPLKIDDATGSTVAAFRYGDAFPWPGEADGAGSSLTLINSSAPANAAGNWRPSLAAGGTPGTHDGVAWDGRLPDTAIRFDNGGALLVLTYPWTADNVDFIPEHSANLTEWSRLGLTPMPIAQDAPAGFRRAAWLLPSPTKLRFARFSIVVR